MPAIRKFDTNHLLLGVKFADFPSTPVLKALGEYNDAVSIDYYTASPSVNVMAKVYEAARKPIIVAEFSWRANACFLGPSASQRYC
jgi:hypothetical protein